jgi:hypothetical protein
VPRPRRLRSAWREREGAEKAERKEAPPNPGDLLYVYSKKPRDEHVLLERVRQLLRIVELLRPSAAPATANDAGFAGAVAVRTGSDDMAGVRAMLETDLSLMITRHPLPHIVVASASPQEAHIMGRLVKVLRGLGASVCDGGPRARAVVYFAPKEEPAVRRALEQQGELRMSSCSESVPELGGVNRKEPALATTQPSAPKPSVAVMQLVLLGMEHPVRVQEFIAGLPMVWRKMKL